MEAGCAKNGRIPFRMSQAISLGMHSDTARRGLKALVTAGLVSLEHRPGRFLEVTLLHAPNEGTSDLDLNGVQK
jgi:hypothetical protein